MEYVISLTSHGNRIKHIPMALSEILHKSDKYKIILTIFESDSQYLTAELKSLVANGILEIKVVSNNLGPHLKYFYTMQKYRDLPVITIDDDCIITQSRIDLLYKAYLEEPKCVHAMRVHEIKFHDGELLPYNKWNIECTTITFPSHRLLATGVGGVIYPPNILKLGVQNIPEIKNCLYADDIYLKVLEIRNGVRIKWIPNPKVHPAHLMIKEVRDMALMKVNNSGRNDTYIGRFKAEFNKVNKF